MMSREKETWAWPRRALWHGNSGCCAPLRDRICCFSQVFLNMYPRVHWKRNVSWQNNQVIFAVSAFIETSMIYATNSQQGCCLFVWIIGGSWLSKEWYSYCTRYSPHAELLTSHELSPHPRQYQPSPMTVKHACNKMTKWGTPSP